MHRKLSLLTSAFFLATAAVAADRNVETIGSSQLSATVGRNFPAIYEYKLGSAAIKGDIDGPKTVKVNGRTLTPAISFTKANDSTACYGFSFKESDITFSVVLQAAGQVVTGRITDIKEGKAKLRTVAFPGHQLISVSANDKAPAFIWTRIIPMVDAPDHYHTLADAPEESITANYAFVENGDIAAGIVSNVIDERERVAIHTRTSQNGKAVSLWCPVWTYRELDTETLEEPWFKVVIADDRNGDGQTDWQDAALLYRENVPRPYRADEVKKIVYRRRSVSTHRTWPKTRS